ncbi:MAG: hypothetical protein IPI46_01300 [Bacteroidetes bacterium]|nr:hypothetical protein [Bacteroidota bacterium]
MLIVLLALSLFSVQNARGQAPTVDIFPDQPVSCHNASDASILASSTLTGTVFFDIDGGTLFANSTGEFFGLSAGTHTVCATNFTDTVCNTITLINPDPLDIQFLVDSMPGCLGQFGGLSAMINGGTILTWPGYLTSWTNSANALLNPIPFNYNTFVQGLPTDTYTLLIEDESSCLHSESFYLPDLCLFVDQHVSCFGANDGSVQASTGAPGSWTYSRDGGLFPTPSGLFLNLTPGVHTICMTDGVNTFCNTVTITQPAPLVVTLAVDQTVSCLGNDGALLATISGGTAILQNYQTTWSAGVNPLTIYDTYVSGLAVGTYTVSVEDDQACISSASVTLGLTPSIVVTASSTAILCHGGTSTVTALSSGGTGAITNTISGNSWIVGAGTYTVTGTDALGCTGTTSITIAEPDAIDITFTIDSLPGCPGNLGGLSAVINGGTPIYQTTWTNSSNSVLNPAPNDYNTFVGGLGVDTYSLLVTDDNNCTHTESISLPDLCLFVDQHVSCYGANDGSVQASTSLAGSWIYSRDGGLFPTPSGLFLNLTPGVHTICMTDGVNTYCDTVHILEPAPLVVSLAVDQTVSCLGNDGAIIATITGGTAILQPYQTTWSAGVTPLTIYDTYVSGLAVGTYTVSVEDDQACISTATVTLGLTPPVVITASAAPVACPGGTTTVTTNATGGTGIITPSISGGTFTVGAGTYTVTGTDANGCTGTTLITITDPFVFDITFNVDSLAGCPGFMGGLSAVITGGTPVYQTTWTNSSNTVLNPAPNDYDTFIGGLSTGTYALQITDANGCTYSESVFVADLCLFVDQHVSCYGANDGSVQASTTLPGSWIFSRDGGLFPTPSGLFLNLTPGVHTICMTDGVNTYCDTVHILEPAPLVVTLAVDQTVSCLGNDGAIIATITGGTAILQPYQTTWSAGVTPLTIYDTYVSGLAVGTYTVSVEDDQACISTATVTLGLTPPVVITASAAAVACPGGTTTVTTNATGGTGIITPSISGGSWIVGAGTYTVTGTDALGCTGTTLITITDPFVFDITFNVDSLAGCPGFMGGLSAVITGGTPVYQTTWTNSSNTVLNPAPNDYDTFIGGLSTGTYALQITDANGCTYSESVFVADLCLFVDQHVSCYGANDGSVQASTTLPGSWIYSRDGGLFPTPSGLFLNLTPGVHTICMTDGLNTYCDTVHILEPAPLVVTLAVDQTVSCLGNDGAIIATITGGTAILQPYQTTWSAGVTPLTIYDTYVSGLAVGTYTVSVEDDQACISTATVTLGLTPPVVITASAAPVACPGGTTTITTNATGGTGTITPSISGGSWVVGAGTYTVTGTDALGCTGTTEITITQPTAFSITLSIDSIPRCAGELGGISASISGGTPGYTTAWTNSSNVLLNPLPNNTITSIGGLTADTYALQITDANGCTYTQSILLPDLCLFVDQHVSCNGANDGSVQATTSIAGSWTFSRDGGQFPTPSGLFLNLTPGIHTICMTDGLNNYCDTVHILEPDPLVVTLTVDSTVSCLGNDGALLANITGGTAILQPYQTTWSAGVTPLTIYDTYVTGLSVGTYTVSVEDDQACISTATVVLGLTAPVTVVANATPIACFGGSTTIVPTTSGGTGAIATTITGGSWTVVAGTYTITATDTKGCTGTTEITLIQPPYLPTTQTVTVCDTYHWNVNNTNYTTSGIYTASFTSVNGCDSSFELHLTVNYSSTSLLPITACDNYTWPENGGTYTTSGMYVHTSINASGCVHTATLDLTVNYSSTSSNSLTVCNNYTWPLNAVTYTTSGVYIHTYTNASGCVHTATLNLTVNYSSSSVETYVVANSYTWLANGTTYTASGTYSHTLTNVSGCDSLLTLNLTILNISVVVDQQVSCSGNSDGSVQAAATGGSGNFTYDIDGANLFTNTTGFFGGLAPGTHTICAMESPSNVQVCGTITITTPNPISITLTVDSTVSCLGNDGGITAVVTGGVTTIQPYLTTWTPSVTVNTLYDLSVTGLTPGTYTLSVEDDNLCFASASITVGLTQALAVTAANTTILCNGGTSIITPTVTGGTGAYSTSISGGTYTVTAGTYTITAIDAKGCTATTEIVVTEPPLYNYSQTEDVCNSFLWTVNNATYTTSGIYTATYTSINGCDSNYTLNLTIRYASSSVETYVVANTYTWLANGTTYTTSGTYTHTMLNVAGCDSSLTLNLTILNISVIVDQNVSCSGNNDGSVQAAATGGSGNFTYDINGANLFSNTTGFFSGLAPGVYTVCAMESPSNVQVCGTVTVTTPTPINIVLTVDSTVSCVGNDGGISAVVTGGVTTIQPYITTWTNGVTTNTIHDLSVTGLAPGTYTLTVEDDNLCFASASITVNNSAPVTVVASAVPIFCAGQVTTITTTTSGGNGAITTAISGGNWTVGAGTYTITGTDAKGCTGTTEITLTEPPVYTSTVSASACYQYTWSVNNQTYTVSGNYTESFVTPAGCDSTQTLILTINGTTYSTENVVAANTYTWIANGTTYTTSGTYTHTLLNSNGCDSSLTLNLQILTIEVIKDQDVSCSGLTDGSAIATALGGSGTFVYDVDGANTFANNDGIILNLSAGVHTICAKEIPSNVVVCGTVTILNANPIFITLTVDSTVSCLGNDGGISAVVTGGTAILQPYLTTWANGVTTNTIYDLSVTGLTPGTYTLTVEDDNACYESASITVGVTAPVTVSASNTTIICHGGTSVITQVASGGTGALVVSITGGNWTVGAGTYTVTATDTKGCTATTVLNITEPPLFAYSETQDVCNSFTWAVNGQSYTTSGVYTASYLSANGCDSIYTLNLTVRYATSSVENVVAANTYTWVANGVTYTTAGTYTHTLTNAANCDSSLTLNLEIITIDVIKDQDVSCSGLTDGSAIATALGGSGTFVYDVDGANTFANNDGIILNLSAGVHTICAKEIPSNVVVCGTVTILNANPIFITLTVDSTVSCLGNDGGISAVVTGGTAILQPYLTTWANGVTTNTIYDLSVTGLTPGTYTLTVEDDNACFESESITVGLTAPVVVTASNTSIICNGGSSVVTPMASGGTGNLTTTISGGSWTVGAGTYTVTATDTKGCTGTTVITITEPAFIAISETQDVCNSFVWNVNSQTYTTSGVYTASFLNVNGCDSVHTLNLTVRYSSSSVENVVAANSYTWVANGVTYTTAGTYTHTLINSVGCDSNLTLNLQILTINVIVDQHVSCNGANNGSAIATASGGSNTFMYDIDGANTYSNSTGEFLGLTPGTHTICAMESPSNVVVCGTVTITEPDAISIVLTVDSITSCLGNDGGISAVVTGGTTIMQPFLTSWSGGSAGIYDLYVTGLTAGTYTLTVEDDNSCFASASITVGSAAPIVVSSTHSAIVCNGGTTTINPSTTGGYGAVTTTISGGLWTVGAGTYTITGTDTKGCTATEVVSITEPAFIAISETQDVCNSFVWNVNSQTYTTSGVYTASFLNVNGCDSVHTLNLTVRYSSSSVENVVAANSYTWVANGVTYTTAGTYTHTLINSVGCDSNLTLNLQILTINVIVDQHVSCNGANDGSAVATANGGSNTFMYDIDGANTFTNTTGIFLGLTPGTHTICAMESPSNVVVCGTVTITEPDAISIVLTVDSITSCLGNDGGISAVVTGGTTIMQPFLTSWSGGSAGIYDLYVTGLTAGTYTLTVEDDNSCFASASITVGSAAPIVVSSTHSAIVCNGGTTTINPSTTGGYGAVTTTISGGLWTVGAGTYTITGTDTKGCTATELVSITEPAAISSSISATACNMYTWASPGGNGNTYTISGTYSYLIAGGASNGCDSTVYLNLTINNSDVHANQIAVACDSYLWNVNQVTYTISGNYVATYVNQYGCDSSYTLTLAINNSSSSTTNVTTGGSYTWNANGTTYTASGTYTATLINAVGCDSILTLNLTIAGVAISPKLFLDGPYVAADGMMHDSLRSQGLIPLTEPYSTAPYNKPNILDNILAEHMVSPSILADTGANAIVDWVFVELRSGTNPATILATKRALLQRDGDVVSSVDGISPLYFSQNAPDNYYVTVKHRNHLGVMTATALPLTLTPTSIDFTTLAPVYVHVTLPPITNVPRKISGSVALLWAGDANANKNVKYNGLANDKEPILTTVGVATPNNTVFGYRIEDVNMDGMVRYNNFNNDKNYILSNTLGGSQNAIISQHTPN